MKMLLTYEVYFYYSDKLQKYNYSFGIVIYNYHYNNKVDIIDRSGKLPINIQAKHTVNTPAYFKIENSCPYKDKSFVLCWKKAPTEGSVSPGAIAMVPMDFFYTLLECYSKSNNLI